jgi:hypothetical protein
MCEGDLASAWQRSEGFVTTRYDLRNGAWVTDRSSGRRIAAVCGLALAAMAPACGSSDGAPPPDAPPEGQTITVETFLDDLRLSSDASLLAIQDGDGPWRRLPGKNGAYSAQVTGPRYAIASICRPYSFELYYLSVSDTTFVRASACGGDTRPRVQVSAQLHGVPSDQLGEVYFGGGRASQQPTGGAFKASLVRGAAVDVLISAIDASDVVRKVYRGPALDALADQTLLYDLDVLGAPLDSTPLTVTGLDPTERIEVRSFLYTRPLRIPWFFGYQAFDTTPPDHFPSVPVAAGRQPGDVTTLYITVVPTHPPVNGGYARFAHVGMTTPAPTSVALPAAWTAAGPTLEHTAQRRVSLSLPAASATEPSTDYRAQLTTGVGGSPIWTLTIGAGWVDGQGAPTVTTPDLSSLFEGTQDLSLPLDHDVTWTLVRSQRNIEFGGAAVDGMQVFATQIYGLIPGSAPPPEGR